MALVEREKLFESHINLISLFLRDEDYIHVYYITIEKHELQYYFNVLELCTVQNYNCYLDVTI